MKTKILKILVIIMVVFFAARAEATSVVYGSGACSFTRDLYQGMYGEDVRCLQQYLSTNVNTASAYGYYGTSYPSYIVADGYYGPMTVQAVMQWQAARGIYSAYGTFDATSRAKYYELNGSGYGTPSYGYSASEQKAYQKIQEALRMIEDAQDEIDDSNKNTSTAENELEDARDDLLDAVHEYFINRDFEEAYDLADDALQNAEDAFDDAGGSNGSKSDAKDAIDDAENAINDAQDEIDYWDDRGRDVDDAQDLLDDAQEKLDDADDEYDDGDYDNAEDYARDAEDLAQEAMDAI
ncbi:MAG: peptidoglycan-binding domain-containing protein [Candidatus Paceibacterota bacterium]|jgi:hypothetical protein